MERHFNLKCDALTLKHFSRNWRTILWVKRLLYIGPSYTHTHLQRDYQSLSLFISIASLSFSLSNIRRALKHGSKLIYSAHSRQPIEILNYDVYMSPWELWIYGYLSCILKLQLKKHNTIQQSNQLQEQVLPSSSLTLQSNAESFTQTGKTINKHQFHCLQLRDHISIDAKSCVSCQTSVSSDKKTN